MSRVGGRPGNRTPNLRIKSLVWLPYPALIIADLTWFPHHINSQLQNPNGPCISPAVGDSSKARRSEDYIISMSGKPPDVWRIFFEEGQDTVFAPYNRDQRSNAYANFAKKLLASDRYELPLVSRRSSL